MGTPRAGMTPGPGKATAEPSATGWNDTQGTTMEPGPVEADHPGIIIGGPSRLGYPSRFRPWSPERSKWITLASSSVDPPGLDTLRGSGHGNPAGTA